MEKLAKACGLGLSELLDFKTEPMALAEDRAAEGFQPTPGKGGRKPRKRR